MKKLLIGSLLLLSGCCSIVDSSHETVSFNTNVDNATIKITNKKHAVIYEGKAPTTISLKKKSGFFSGETYRIQATKNGYINSEQVLDTRLNGWYWGNILFGGLIGMLIVDPATGAMWTFDDENVFVNLSKESTDSPK